MITAFLNWSKNNIDQKRDIIIELLHNNFEVIIINNEVVSDQYIKVENLYIPKYEYFGNYNLLKEYCLELTTNKLFFIWSDEEDIPIEKIMNLEFDDNYSYYCNYKIFINSSDYIVKKLPFVFNRNEWAKEIFLSDMYIIDKSISLINLDTIEGIILKVLGLKDISLLVTLLSNIRNSNNVLLEKKFYEVVEKIKQNLLYEEVVEIDRELLKHDIFDRCYNKFLQLKMKLFETNKLELSNDVKEIFKLDNIYVSVIIRYLIENRLIDEFFDLIVNIDIEILKAYVAYLLNNFEDFYKSYYGFMIKIDAIREISIKNNPRVSYLKELAKTYVVLLSDISYDVEKKQMLIQMFVDYCNYGIYTTNKLLKSVPKYLNQEAKFILEIDKAIEAISKNEIKNAIERLSYASKIYPIMEKPILFYIERLRIEYQVKNYRLSVCMIVKDEEKNLRRCLESLKPLMESNIAELIIVDTGSKDNTVSIAKEYTDKVYFHSWQGSFSEARNYSISLAQGEYIFIMDADEELEEGGAGKLIELFSNDEYKNYNTFTFKVKNFKDESLDSFVMFTQALIFKNDGSFYYAGTVHNQPIFKGPIKHVDITVIHYGYIMNNDEIRERKFKRTATLLKKELSKNPNNIYYRYQLAVSYDMYGNLDEAIRHAKIYLDKLYRKKGIERGDLMYYGTAIRLFLRKELYEEVIEISEKVLKVEPTYIDLLFYCGYAYFKKNDFANAIKYIENYLTIYDEFHLYEIANDQTISFYTLDQKLNAKKMLLYSYYQMKEYKKLLFLASNIDFVSMKEDFYNTIPLIVESAICEDEFEFLKKMIESLEKSNLDIEFVYFSIFRVLLSLKEDAVDRYYHLMGIDALEQFKFFKKINDYIFNNEGSMDGLIVYDDEIKINQIRKFIRFLLTNKFIVKNITEEKVIKLLDYYIEMGFFLISNYREQLLENREIIFLSYILDSFENLKGGKIKEALFCLKESVQKYNELAVPVQIYIKKLDIGKN